MKTFKVLSLTVLIYFILSFYSMGFPLEGDLYDDVEKEMKEFEGTDQAKYEQHLENIINRHKNDEAVLFIYYKLFSVYSNLYYQGVITKEEYETKVKNNAKRGLETSRVVKKENDGRFKSNYSYIYWGLFYEYLGDLEKSQGMFEIAFAEDDLFRVFLKQRKYKDAAKIIDKVSKNNIRDYMLRYPDFYQYLLDNNLIKDLYKLSDSEILVVKIHKKLSQLPWIFPDSIKEYKFEDQSLDKKISDLFVNFKSIASFLDIIQKKDGIYPRDLFKVSRYRKDQLKDPFSSENMNYLSGFDEILVWSNGPDQDNDKALIMYDPTNGTISNGDIILKKILPSK